LACRSISYWIFWTFKNRSRKFRSGPIEVVSGRIGTEKVNYQAPSADKIQAEMKNFLIWWTKSEKKVDGIIRAGVAHFYFVTIHPFDDGNGRISRALTDMALAQDDKISRRYYSLSSEIVKKRKEYYEILEKTQKGDKNITDWLQWFINCFSSALDNSNIILQDVFCQNRILEKKSKYQHKFKTKKSSSKTTGRRKKQICRWFNYSKIRPQLQKLAEVLQYEKFKIW
jgi:Fic family protein